MNAKELAAVALLPQQHCPIMVALQFLLYLRKLAVTH